MHILFVVLIFVWGGFSGNIQSVQNDSTVLVVPADSVKVTEDSLSVGLEADTIGIKNAQKAGADTTAAPASEQKRLGKIQQLVSLPKILTTLLILVLTYLVNVLAGRIIDNLSEKVSRYRMFIKRTIPAVRVFLWAFALYIIIQGVIRPSLETIIALTASLGIAVGFASQDILKNIFGGFMIILDRPFQVGDKIEVGGYYGEVQQIGMRSTRIVTPDDSVVTIPNAELMNKSVSNANSSQLDCQVVAEIYLPATVDLELAKKIAYRAAVSSRFVYLKKPVVVIAKNEIHEKNFVIKLRVKAYVLDIRYEFPFQSDMTELIMNEMNRRQMLPAET